MVAPRLFPLSFLVVICQMSCLLMKIQFLVMGYLIQLMGLPWPETPMFSRIGCMIMLVAVLKCLVMWVSMCSRCKM